MVLLDVFLLSSFFGSCCCWWWCWWYCVTQCYTWLQGHRWTDGQEVHKNNTLAETQSNGTSDHGLQVHVNPSPIVTATTTQQQQHNTQHTTHNTTTVTVTIKVTIWRVENRGEGTKIKLLHQLNQLKVHGRIDKKKKKRLLNSFFPPGQIVFDQINNWSRGREDYDHLCLTFSLNPNWLTH